MWKPCIILVVVALITVSLWAQEPIKTENARAEVEGPTVLSQHPRLHFRKDDLSWIRQRCATTHREWYRRMKSHVDALMEVGAGADGVQHAMLYQITGDEKYVQAALDASDKTPDQGVYDLLYEATDPETRQRYADRLPLVGSRPWGGISYDDATIGLALYGDGVVTEKRAEILSHLTTFVPPIFDKYTERTRVPGGWMASFHCGCFVRNMLPIYSQWTVATGENRFVDSYVWPAQSTWMAQHLIPGRWTLVPLSSAWWGEGKTLDRAALPEVAHFTGNGFTQHLVNRFRKYCVWEYAPNPGAYGYNEGLDPEHIGLGYWHSGVHNVYRMILWYDPKMPERPISDLPKTALYPQWGRACMRTSWNDDATFAVFKCGWYWGGEPPHHDDGNLAVYHKGNLVLDNNWNFRGCNALSVNQNTITVLDPDETIMLAMGRDIGKRKSKVNAGGQSFYDRKQTGPFDRGKVVAFEDNPQFLYVAGDATKSYHPNKMKEFVRQFVYVKPNIILIFDRVESTKPEFEKRFVMHTHTEPTVTDGVLRADASELLLAQPRLKAVYPYKYGNFVRDSVPGFHQPQYEHFEADWQTVAHKDDEPFTSVVASKVPNRKVTLEFECSFGNEEVALVHSTGPQYGTVNWSLDAGKQEGTFSQHAVTSAYQQKHILVRDLAKGKHTLTLAAPTSLMNIEVFEVKLGGRMFVKTLLPENAKSTVVEGFPESGGYHARDRYSVKRRYRLEVRPSKPAKRDFFLHVIEVGDLKTSKMTDVTTIADGDTSGVAFELDGRQYRVVFNRTGEVGGRVSITGDGVRVNRRLTETLNTPKDETMEASLAKARNTRRYDYETRELGELGPKADVATLGKALKAPKWYLRYYAARMLGMKGVKQAEKDLVAALSDDDPRVASATAEALGRLESSAAVLPLTKQLSSPDATARFSAAWGLGRIGNSDDAVMRALTRTLGNDDPFVVYAAGDALGRLTRKADAETVAALIKVAGTKDHLAAEKACEVLGNLKVVEAVPVLEKLALEGNTSERIAGARALAKMNRPETAAFLRDYIKQDKGEAVARLAGAMASGRVELMQELMDEPEMRVRQKAVFELARKGDRFALDRLHGDLKSKSFATRHGAAWALYRVGDNSGLVVLARDRLKVQTWSVCDSAGKILNHIDGFLGDKRPVVKALVDAVTEFIDEAEAKDTTGDYPTTGRSLYFIHLQLAKCTGKKFYNWSRFKASKKAREQLKQRWLDYWEQEGQDLPEVPVKPGRKPAGGGR